MKTNYFKTRAAMDAAAKEIDENAKVVTIECDCGDSPGYDLDDQVLILCE